MAYMGKKQQGLTLVELMVTLAVAIILISVGMPLFTGMAANNRTTAQANELVTALKLARSEAVKRSAAVTARGTGGSWNAGWSVFVDANADGVLDAGEEVLRNWDALMGSSVNSGGAQSVVFLATGENSGAQVDLELLPDDTNILNRCISVTVTGQVRIMREERGQAWSCP